jgi:tRNA threonylcarbamoyladenosine biosynthesis protein TsaB
MIVLGFDTATAATAVALLGGGNEDAGERRHDPAPGERPGHGTQLLVLARELLDEAGLSLGDVDRVAVGVGPGGFTGLRIGVATARALAQAADAEIVGVSTLEALAVAAEPAPGQGVLAVVDARRGEVFVAGWRDGEQVLGARAIAPALAGTIAGEGWLAVGDGALRFRDDLEGAGCEVPVDGSDRHGVSALAVCRLARRARHGTERDLVVPDYLRKPDAVRSKP